jgi:hypothetical protein
MIRRPVRGEVQATKWPSGRATVKSLGQRIGQMHLGEVRMSTFCWTLAAILFERLDVQVGVPMVLMPSSEEALPG